MLSVAVHNGKRLPGEGALVSQLEGDKGIVVGGGEEPGFMVGRTGEGVKDAAGGLDSGDGKEVAAGEIGGGSVAGGLYSGDGKGVAAGEIRGGGKRMAAGEIGGGGKGMAAEGGTRSATGGTKGGGGA